jgi:hypothetical protein
MPEVGSVPESWADDDQLFAALKEALRAGQAVPPEFIEAGKSAYAWRNIDAELASLTYDSTRDLVTSVRAETASIRALTFTSAHLIIELEVGGESLHGQVVPAGEGTIEIQTRDGVAAAVGVDSLGWFAIHPIPASPFRLRYRTTDGTDVLTGWITL